MHTTPAGMRLGIRRWAAATALALSLAMGPGLATTAEAQWTLAPATPSAGTGPDAVVAMVEWSPITKGAVAWHYHQRLATYAGSGGDLFSRKLLGLELGALQDLVDREIALLEARRLRIDVTPADVRAWLATLPALQEHGRYVGEARALELLARHQPRLRREALLEQFRRDLIVARLVEHVTRGTGPGRPQSYEAFLKRARSLARVTVYPALLSQIVLEAR